MLYVTCVVHGALMHGTAVPVMQVPQQQCGAAAAVGLPIVIARTTQQRSGDLLSGSVSALLHPNPH